MSENYVVIMAGGRGERFWPESRLNRPKHLLPIVGAYPMLRQTLERIRGLVPDSRVLVLTNV
ncbi:MAG: sugar phosphate nucleotidyltransferase, partial [Opitutales bacterium]|nr:sugar phosphate nucleotidyltransferase [Opitutales bacterium]